MLLPSEEQTFITNIYSSHLWLLQSKMPEQPAQLRISPAAGHFAFLQNQAPDKIKNKIKQVKQL